MYCHFCYLNCSVCNMKHRQAHVYIRLAHKLMINSIQRNDAFSRSIVLVAEVCVYVVHTVLCYKERHWIGKGNLTGIVLKEACSLGRPQADHRAPQMTLVNTVQVLPITDFLEEIFRCDVIK